MATSGLVNRVVLRLLVEPAHSSRKTWWRTMQGPTEVSVLAHGRWQPATGEVVLPGAPRHRPLTEVYARRWPRVNVTGEPIVSIVLDRTDPASVPGLG